MAHSFSSFLLSSSDLLNCTLMSPVTVSSWLHKWYIAFYVYCMHAYTCIHLVPWDCPSTPTLHGRYLPSTEGWGRQAVWRLTQVCTHARIHTQTETHTDTDTDRQRHRHTQTDRQKQTDRQTHTHTTVWHLKCSQGTTYDVWMYVCMHMCLVKSHYILWLNWKKCDFY